ncbi:hypothetical protein [Mycolicibacterium monacense]|uniref:Membrane protein n=2 Tax=Mycobacteriaceae TaxID=1762 RepID=A0AAD1IZH0_MYCMB|nr:hypothetical protein [Mycolicibacterium monacense]MDA4100109.1 membrane protein [Mycolicibacterium monacense DSM 44395]OBB73152.1 hypothetical protein A6B34_15250 [Mycolicibacterium monacense]ORB20299.1 hypothetical protein BST34_13220 [Mycolicibacterium monacense DSM 44395]QHP84407.1 hypothetical protein EWR22_02965 [Mycolicibacterium monacense DSM 44395]BBZ62835.1 membrane protein [Mycolicibacterium monacense]
MPQQDNRAAKLTGLAIAGTGLAHFVRPQVFEPITVAAFPQNTRRHIYTNGSLETAIGLALAGRRTRKFGLAGLLGYAVYLAGNTVRKR